VIPGFDEDILRFIRIILILQLFDTNFHPILGKQDILLLHLMLSALGELVAEDVHVIPNIREDAHKSKEEYQWYQLS